MNVDADDFPKNLLYIAWIRKIKSLLCIKIKGLRNLSSISGDKSYSNVVNVPKVLLVTSMVWWRERGQADNTEWADQRYQMLPDIMLSPLLYKPVTQLHLMTYLHIYIKCIYHFRLKQICTDIKPYQWVMNNEWSVNQTLQQGWQTEPCAFIHSLSKIFLVINKIIVINENNNKAISRL